MVASVDEILMQAVRDKCPLRLACADNPAAPYVARALQWSDAAGAEGLWLHLPEADDATVARLARTLPAVAVSFAIDRTRHAFESKVLDRNPRFWCNDTVMLDALLLAAPHEIRQVQERRCERLPVSEGSGVSAQLYRLEKKPDASGAAQGAGALVPVDGNLQDLSLTGAGFLCAPDRALLSARRGERMACIIEFRGSKILLVASLARVTNVSTRAMRIGVDFKAHENERAMAGKLAELANVVQELERQDSLRRR
jgi:hypothetical protein